MRLPLQQLGPEPCDECTLDDGLRSRSQALMLKILPFYLTFGLVFALALWKLFPWLSGTDNKTKDAEHKYEQLPLHNGPEKKKSGVGKRRLRSCSCRTLATIAFASSVAFSVVFVEAIFAEIVGVFDPQGRALALRVALPSILVYLILIAPALEIYTFLSAAGCGTSRFRLLWFLEITGVTGWLCAFWWLGKSLLKRYSRGEIAVEKEEVMEGCLVRIAILGISVMASLAAFGACSALWQKFGADRRIVTEADIAHKQAGLAATEDMILTKESRLNAIQRKLADGDTPPQGFVNRVIGSWRANPDEAENSALQLEISGLQTMQTALSNELLALKDRYDTQLRSRTAIGRMESVWQLIFCTYCLYRICSTTFKTVCRFTLPTAASSGASTGMLATDPVTLLVTFIAKIYDPTINRDAWSALLSVLLSILMLLASLNGALQTLFTISRILPTQFLSTARANFALLVSQVLGMYVISSALLVRANLPKEVGSIVTDALGAPLDPQGVERWFEMWFLGACAVIGLAIWLGRKFRGAEWDGVVEEERLMTKIP